MITFLTGLFILIIGYFFYGRFIEKQFAPESKKVTPSLSKHPDGVSPMSHWRCMLLQFLHIAGVGPVIGVIMGAKFGPVVLLIIPIGNIIGGAVHDYLFGMISMRNGAGSFLRVAGKFFNKPIAIFSSLFMLMTLTALCVCYTNVGSSILSSKTFFESSSILTYILFVCLIFVYYILSVFFPIQKVIGRLYTLFGVFLSFSTVLILVLMFPHIQTLNEFDISNFWKNFSLHPQQHPILPMLFVTIACGIISGFHGSQNSITASMETNEKNGRQTFYGMMVMEGFLAMVWAVVGIWAYQNYPYLLNEFNGAQILSEALSLLVQFDLGVKLILISVVILAITTASAAINIVRILIADYFKLSQRFSEDRFLLCIPILGVCAIFLFWSNISPDGFFITWTYFTLTNQIIAVLCLAVSVSYLRSKNKSVWYALIPLAFMSFIVSLYILWISPQHILNAPQGFGLNYWISCVLAVMSSIFICAASLKRGKTLSELAAKNKFNPDSAN